MSMSLIECHAHRLNFARFNAKCSRLASPGFNGSHNLAEPFSGLITRKMEIFCVVYQQPQIGVSWVVLRGEWRVGEASPGRVYVERGRQPPTPTCPEQSMIFYMVINVIDHHAKRCPSK